MTTEDPDELITATRAAELLGVAHSTFRGYAARGLIRPAKNYGGEGHGSRPMYRLGDVQAFVKPTGGRPVTLPPEKRRKKKQQHCQSPGRA